MRTTTTRGVLWEVLAPVVRWPMYSPGRLGLVAVTILALAFVVGEVTSARDQHGSAAITADPTPPGGHASSPSAPPTSASAPTETADPASSATVQRLARRFVTVYIDSELPRPQWLRQLRGIATGDLGTALATVDQANFDPGERVTGAQVRGLGSTAATVVVETDAREIRVDLAHSGTEWEVASVIPDQRSVDPTD